MAPLGVSFRVMPPINIEFYQPTVESDDGLTFADVLTQVENMPMVQRLRTDFDPAGIFGLTRDGDEFMGDAARIRMEDLPRIVNLATGQRHDLNVRPREGLSEEMHFIYDATVDVIAIQVKRQMRASALRGLLADLTQQRIGFNIILREDALQRFQHMGLVKKIFFKIARPQDLQGQAPPALVQVFRELDEFNGVAAKVEISVERARNRWLSMDAVRGILDRFRARNADFDALSITGLLRDEGVERQETIDFVHEHLRHTEEVERRGRRLAPEGCRVALRRAIRAHRPYLLRLRA
ncbi:MAG TPA: DUF6731 family protein [Candidatus Acidoferrales bacterium]|nr:DUF6731 family protein [Candidatus Acidoferrales bacterium]